MVGAVFVKYSNEFYERSTQGPASISHRTLSILHSQQIPAFIPP